MIEIELINDESFLIIKETLQRIGLTNRDMDILIQSCHILHKKEKYYIVHFKEMLHMDGGDNKMDIYDENRLKFITNLLVSWGLCNSKEDLTHVFDPIVRVVPHKERCDWTFKSKYTMGNKYKYDGEFG